MNQKLTTRRQLAKAGLRGLAAAAVLLLAGGLSIKRLLQPDDWSTKNRCTNDSVCNGCDRLQTCILPQAASTREARP